MAESPQVPASPTTASAPLASPSPPSPLAEASPDSISELYARDPLKLTDTDYLRIVENLRKERLRLESGAPQKKKAPKAKKASAPVSEIVNSILEEDGL